MEMKKLSKSEAQKLLQVVEDSYIRTAKLKAAYEEYQILIKRFNNWKQGTTFLPPKEKEAEQLKEYEAIFANYEVNAKNKNYWYKESTDSFSIEMEGTCSIFKENLDPFKKFLKKCEWKGTFFNKSDYSVEGNVYQKEGAYYLSFDGSIDVWDDFLTADLGILTNNFAAWIEKANNFFQTAIRNIPDLNADNVVFLGHSLGGALAGTLAAAVYLNAFNDKNKFTLSRFQKDSPEPLGINIRAVTFNAPQMGGVFDKIKVDFGTGNYSVRTTRIPDERLRQVNVASVGMEDDYVFNLHGRKKGENQIGSDMLVLNQDDGMLKKISNDGVTITKLLEAAKRIDKLNIFTYLKVKIKEKIFWHFISTLALALCENKGKRHIES
jgi:hypothetical protein